MSSCKRLFMGFISVLGVVALTLFVNPIESAQSAGSSGSSLGEVVGYESGSLGGCDVPPTWKGVILGKERWVPILFDEQGNSHASCDRQTGLVWETVPSTESFVWGGSPDYDLSAQRHCINRTVGTNGQKGWRLPSVVELASLVDTTSSICTVDGKCLPDGSPFELAWRGVYWSTSELAGDTKFAWVVGFGSGYVDTGVKGTRFRVWCVRGPMQESVY